MTTEATKQTTEIGWTTTLPEQQGWYWVRTGPLGLPAAVEFFPAMMDRRRPMVRYPGKDGFMIALAEGVKPEWLGPISPADFEQLAALKEALKRIRDCTQDMWACSFAGEVIKGASLEDALRHAEKYDEDGGITRLAALRAAAKQALRTLDSEAKQLEAWATQSVDGGWSTHQVGPMRVRADELRREAAALREATG